MINETNNNIQQIDNGLVYKPEEDKYIITDMDWMSHIGTICEREGYQYPYDDDTQSNNNNTNNYETNDEFTIQKINFDKVLKIIEHSNKKLDIDKLFKTYRVFTEYLTPEQIKKIDELNDSKPQINHDSNNIRNNNTQTEFTPEETKQEEIIEEEQKTQKPKKHQSSYHHTNGMRKMTNAISKIGAIEVKSDEFYYDLFKMDEDYLQNINEPGGQYKTNPILVGFKIIEQDGNKTKKINYQRILFKNTINKTIEEYRKKADMIAIAPATYYGRHNTLKKMSKLFAFTIDLDYPKYSYINKRTGEIIKQGISGKDEYNSMDAFRGFNEFTGKAIFDPTEIQYAFIEYIKYEYNYMDEPLIPNYVAFSGSGVHFYFLFDEPINIYPGLADRLATLKKEFSRYLWKELSGKSDEPQLHGINQSYRVPGSKTKHQNTHGNKYCKMFKIPYAHKYTLTDISMAVDKEYQILDYDIQKKKYYNTTFYTKEQMKEIDPEWYQRKIINREKGILDQWKTSPKLYEWWLDILKTSKQVKHGHRYYCLVALAIFAAKSGIYDYDRIYADAKSVQNHLTLIYPDDPITDHDIEAALSQLGIKLTRFKREKISSMTGVEIIPCKRNGRTREEHLEYARGCRDENQTKYGTNWWDDGNRDGAPTKQAQVEETIKQYFPSYLMLKNIIKPNNNINNKISINIIKEIANKAKVCTKTAKKWIQVNVLHRELALYFNKIIYSLKSCNITQQSHHNIITTLLEQKNTYNINNIITYLLSHIFPITYYNINKPILLTNYTPLSLNIASSQYYKP